MDGQNVRVDGKNGDYLFPSMFIGKLYNTYSTKILKWALQKLLIWNSATSTDDNVVPNSLKPQLLNYFT